jgi:hypothetical protein
MTQLERTRECIRCVLNSHGFCETARIAVAELRDILDEAQNEPPQGAADGSVGAELWTTLRDFAFYYERAATFAARAQKEIAE